MKTNDIAGFAALMTGLGELYGKAITEAYSEIYWNTLKSFDFADVQRAVKHHVADPEYGRFMPKPADIIRWIEGTQDSKALQAWTKVVLAMRRVGSYNSIKFDDPIIHTVIEAMGGWVQLCMTTNHELSFRAIEFQKHYVGYLLNPPKTAIPHLCGLLPSQSPIQIGFDGKGKKALAYQTSTSDAINDASRSKTVHTTNTR